MIRYMLRCCAEHRFESWFQSAEAFASLDAAGQLSCPLCGETRVGKDLMAPSVRHVRRNSDQEQGPDKSRSRANLTEPASEFEAALAALRRQIEDHSEYVGMNFSTEARRIHEGLAPERSIYGEAGPDEARRMIEDGLPVAPLPFMPVRKVN